MSLICTTNSPLWSLSLTAAEWHFVQLLPATHCLLVLNVSKSWMFCFQSNQQFHPAHLFLPRPGLNFKIEGKWRFPVTFVRRGFPPPCLFLNVMLMWHISQKRPFPEKLISETGLQKTWPQPEGQDTCMMADSHRQGRSRTHGLCHCQV